ncbi:putative secreted protein (Por secretion system target) [Cellulophaga sp. RHA19]|uniref:T9SS type A sorting domain-containing protein n=1 Tax=Cellulophaga sp. RHA19 TaxID=1798237 RepID=UPI000C2BCBA0|nr:T9SS type A sorting domain-containing protein [Cellulophaga sp. RHA19]PKB42063.1 putative secreted protein (Por secretion system target) [Cellulophaga sp. RHA19]
MKSNDKLSKLLLVFITVLFTQSNYLCAQNFSSAPELITPRETWQISKEALSFRFIAPNDNSFRNIIKNNVISVGGFDNIKPKPFAQQTAVYRIQISKEEDFSSSSIIYSKHLKLWSMQHGTTQHIPNQIFSPGTYYWRMRCEVDKGGTKRTSPWSVKKKFKLVNKSVQPMRYKISDSNPLFVIADAHTAELHNDDASYFANMHKDGFTKNDFSANKRKHVAVVLNDRSKGAERFIEDNYAVGEYLDLYNKIEDWGYKTMIFHQYSLAEQDWFYRKYPNCIGNFTGETEDLVLYYEKDDEFNKETNLFFNRSLKLAELHGGYFMNATHYYSKAYVSAQFSPMFTNSEVYNNLKKYSKHIIWGTKNNSSYAKHVMDGYWQGLWLDNVIGQRVAWIENYFNRSAHNINKKVWPLVNSKSTDTYTPITLMSKEMLYSAANGGTVFVIRDNDNSTNDDAANRRSARRDHLYKLFEKIVDEKLITPKAQVKANTKKAVQFITAAEHGTRKKEDYKTIYQKYKELFSKTHKVTKYDNEKIATDVIPDNQGTYGIIPIVSKFSGAADWRVTRLKLDDINTGAKVNNAFNAKAPHKGTAWVNKTGKKYIILNSVEGRKYLDNQTYNIDFGDSNFINSIKGGINISTYIVSKLNSEGDKLTLIVNSNKYQQYLINKPDVKVASSPIENTKILVNCDSKPKVTLNIDDALVSSDWDGSTKTLTLKIKHDAKFNDIVTVTINENTSTASANKTLLETKTDSLNKEVDQENLKLFPNPTTNFLQVDYKKDSQIKEIFIRDVNGLLIKTVNYTNTTSPYTVDVSKLSKGIYFLSFKDSSKIITKKFIVN